MSPTHSAGNGSSPGEHQLDESDDLTVLGAAATLPAQRTKGPDRSERKSEKARNKDFRSKAEAQTADTDTVVSVFEPHLASTPPVGEYLRSLWQRRKFMIELAKSDIKGRRSSTTLGSLWNVLDPLFQAGIYFFLYLVIRGNSGNATRPPEFLPVLVGGVFLFTLAGTALNDGGRSVRRSSSLMLNSSFPRAILPISAVYKGILQFIPTAGVYVVIYAIAGAAPQRGLLMLPVLVFIQTILGIGIALTVATIVVFFADFGNLLRYIQRILFFTTPVIFPASLIAAFEPWVAMQPFYALFSSYQAILGGGTADPTMVLISVAWATFFLVVGFWVFLRHEQAMASQL